MRVSSPPKVRLIDDCVLRCPVCQGENLHHCGVMIWQRAEDEETGTLVASTRAQTRIFEDVEMEDCPSPRRDAVSVHFWCEECSSISILEIVQHEGATYFDWQLTDDKKTPGL